MDRRSLESFELNRFWLTIIQKSLLPEGFFFAIINSISIMNFPKQETIIKERGTRNMEDRLNISHSLFLVFCSLLNIFA